MALGTGAGGVAEHRRRVDDDAHAVGDDRLVVGIVFRLVVPDQPGHRIGHAVRHMHARIAEGDAGQRRGPHQLLARLVVRRVVHRAHHEFAGQPQRLAAAEVGPGIRALAHRPLGRRLRARAARKRHGGIGFQRVAEHVEGAAGDHVLRQGMGGQRVDQGQCRAQHPRGDAGLGLHRQQIEDGNPGAFRAGAGGRRAGDMGLQRPRNRAPLAHRRIHIGQEVGRVCRIEAGRLGGIHHRTAADRDEAIDLRFRRKTGGGLEGDVRRLHLHLVVKRIVDAGRGQRLFYLPDMFRRGQALVGEQRDTPDPQRPGLLAGLGQAAGAVSNGGHIDGEGLLAALDRREIVMAACHAVPP